MYEPITAFSGRYFFLSNFYVGKHFTYEGLTYSNGEAAFQGGKLNFFKEQDLPVLRHYESRFNGYTSPGEAKRIGRQMPIDVPRWERHKYRVMQNVLTCKFTQDRNLANKLLATGHSDLIEGNTWGDQIWGQCGGVGQNLLGVMLMELRGHLRRGTPA